MRSVPIRKQSKSEPSVHTRTANSVGLDVEQVLPLHWLHSRARQALPEAMSWSSSAREMLTAR